MHIDMDMDMVGHARSSIHQAHRFPTFATCRIVREENAMDLDGRARSSRKPLCHLLIGDSEWQSSQPDVACCHGWENAGDVASVLRRTTRTTLAPELRWHAHQLSKFFPTPPGAQNWWLGWNRGLIYAKSLLY